jgi:hypothetical protein
MIFGQYLNNQEQCIFAVHWADQNHPLNRVIVKLRNVADTDKQNVAVNKPDKTVIPNKNKDVAIDEVDSV